MSTGLQKYRKMRIKFQKGYRNDTNTVFQKTYNNYARTKALTIVDGYFAGQTVWSSKKLEEVCEFELE